MFNCLEHGISGGDHCPQCYGQEPKLSAADLAFLSHLPPNERFTNEAILKDIARARQAERQRCIDIVQGLLDGKPPDGHSQYVNGWDNALVEVLAALQRDGNP